MGGKLYLIVKNEKEFYRGFYSQPDIAGGTASSELTELNMERFSGNLLLSNLETKAAFLLRYKNGVVLGNSAHYKTSSSLKTMGIPTISYWEQECHTEVRRCTFVSVGYSYCSGEIMVIYSEYCNWPSPMCGMAFSLTDSSDEEICEDVWFPDPPTDPGEGGGSSGGGTGATAPTTDEQFLSDIDTANLSKCFKDALKSALELNGSPASLIRSFSIGTPGFNWVLETGTLPANTNGSTSPYNSSAKSVTTTFDASKFTSGSDLAILRTLLHEGIHAYLVTYFKLDPIHATAEYSAMVEEWTNQNKGDINDVHHDEFVRSFISSMGNALQEYGDTQGYTFSSSLEKGQFYDDLAWGGLTGTHAFQQKSTAEKTRINNRLASEQTGLDTNGNSMPKKGKNGGC